MNIPASFTVDGQTLHGMLHLPDTQRPPQGHRCVVIMHGFTGNRGGDHRLLPLLSRRLQAAGVASLRFDFRGSGESDGDFSEMTVAREREDARAAFNFARAHPEIDPRGVSLLGFSMGGLVAALTAPLLKPERLALWAPALPACWRPVGNEAEQAGDVLDYNGWPLSRAFLEEMQGLTPLQDVRGYTGAARVFHGTADEAVPVKFGRSYADALGCDIVEIEGANHTFDGLGWVEELYAATVEFLTADLPVPA